MDGRTVRGNQKEQIFGIGTSCKHACSSITLEKIFFLLSIERNMVLGGQTLTHKHQIRSLDGFRNIPYKHFKQVD